MKKLTDKQNELIKEYFWEEPDFIMTMLNKIKELWIDELLNDYKYNLWFSHWFKQWIENVFSQMEEMFQDQSEDIIKELWAIPEWSDENK